MQLRTGHVELALARSASPEVRTALAEQLADVKATRRLSNRCGERRAGLTHQGVEVVRCEEGRAGVDVWRRSVKRPNCRIWPYSGRSFEATSAIGVRYCAGTSTESNRCCVGL